MKQVIYDIARPYTAVYIIFRRKQQVAFVLRENTKWMNGFYGLPAGRVEKGESFISAAIREAKEEVGVDIHTDDLKLVLVGHRNSPDSLWVDIVFEAISWKGELYNAEPHVHSQLSWLSLDALPSNIVPSVRDYIDHIQGGKNYIEIGFGKSKNESV